MFNKYRGIGVFLLFALIIRLLLFFILSPWNEEVLNSTFFIVPDTKVYHNLALNLLNNHNFNQYNYFRTPGYPVFIAMIYSVFGIKPWVVLLFQIIFNLFCLVAIYILAKEIFNKKTAFVAVLLYSIEPHSILHTSILLSDTLLTSFFLFSACSLYFSINRKNMSLLILSAILLGVTSYFKQINQYFIFFSILLIMLSKDTSFLNKIKKILVYTFFYFLVIFPWMYHNYSRFDHFRFATTQGYNLLMYNVSIVESNRTGKSIKQVKKEFELQVNKFFKEPANVFDYAIAYNQISYNYILSQPFLFIKNHLNGVKNLFLSLNTHTFMRHFGLTQKKNPISIFKYSNYSTVQSVRSYFSSKPTVEIIIGLTIACYLFFIYIFFFFGSYYTITKKKYFPFFFLLIIIIYFSFLAGSIGYARFKLPVIPFYTIISAAGILYLRNFIWKKWIDNQVKES